MRIALRQARMACERGETPVGALVAGPDGKIIGAFGNEVEARNDPTAHAEILALREAARITGNYRLEGCLLVSTLEPCLMCAGAIAHSRVAGLVYGAADSQAGAISSAADFWELPGVSREIWHMGGVLADECAGILRAFFRARR